MKELEREVPLAIWKVHIPHHAESAMAAQGGPGRPRRHRGSLHVAAHLKRIDLAMLLEAPLLPAGGASTWSFDASIAGRR